MLPAIEHLSAAMTDTAVLLCGHGSRDPEALAEFGEAAAVLRPRLAAHDFATAFLEFAPPTIGEGLALLQARGARRILVIPAMLFAASHVKIDLPREIAQFRAANPSIDIHLGRDLGSDARLVRATADRIGNVAPDRGAETLLVVVGRGTNDPPANAAVAAIARRLGERLGFGEAEAAYGGIAHPRLDAALDRAARHGFRRIVVFPYFLFTGVLAKRVYAQTDACAARFPEIEFIKVRHLGDHIAVVDAFVDRVAECLTAGIAEGDFCSIRS